MCTCTYNQKFQYRLAYVLTYICFCIPIPVHYPSYYPSYIKSLHIHHQLCLYKQHFFMYQCTSVCIAMGIYARNVIYTVIGTSMCTCVLIIMFNAFNNMTFTTHTSHTTTNHHIQVHVCPYVSTHTYTCVQAQHTDWERFEPSHDSHSRKGGPEREHEKKVGAIGGENCSVNLGINCG